MKKAIPILFVFFLLYGLTNKEDIVIPDYAIRFRVIANSDSKEDQKLKLEVKNELDETLNTLMMQAKNSQEAKMLLEKNMNTIHNIVDKYTENNLISLGKNYFPEKEYQGIKYPSGDYESLVITLGSGKGKNWWCVMFPPLCLLEAKENETDEVEYKFYFQEVLEKYTS